MAIGLHYAIIWMGPALAPHAPLHTQAVAVLTLVILAMISYFALAFGTGGASLAMIRRNVKRGAKAAEATPTDAAP